MGRIVIILTLIIMTGCSTFYRGFGIGTSSDLNHLRYGMTANEVVEVMDEPNSTELLDGHMRWQYEKHVKYLGHKTFLLEFNKKGKLVRWYREDQKRHNDYISEPIKQEITIKRD